MLVVPGPSLRSTHELSGELTARDLDGVQFTLIVQSGTWDPERAWARARSQSGSRWGGGGRSLASLRPGDPLAAPAQHPGSHPPARSTA